MKQKEQTIQIRYGKNAFPPERHGAWIDLAIPEAVHMERGEFRILPFNISMKMPDGYEGHIVPRSSTCKNWGLLMANSMGIIENDYCGDDDVWGFPANRHYSRGDEDRTVPHRADHGSDQVRGRTHAWL